MRLNDVFVAHSLVSFMCRTMVFGGIGDWCLRLCICSRCVSNGSLHSWIYDVPTWDTASACMQMESSILLYMFCFVLFFSVCVFFLQILLVHVPLLYYLNHTLARNSKTCHRWICTCIMIVCVMIQLLWILTAYPYGYWALIISPGATWPLVLTVWMIYKSLKRRI